MGSVEVSARGRPPADCGLCHDSLTDGALSCPGCRASYHPACVDELGPRCATLGCGELLNKPKREREPVEATRPTPAEAMQMSPRGKLAVAIVLAVLGTGCLILQIVITVNGDWAEPVPTWWQLAISMGLFGVVQIALGVFAAVSGVRELRRG